MSLITNPLVNSYKRLVSGFEAPVFIGWALKSKSQILRIPSSRGEKTKIELRSPDSSANPYLVLASILAAGLDGIKNEVHPPKNMEENLNNLSKKELENREISLLPGNLDEAIQAFEEDTFLSQVLGADFAGRLIEMKRAEWEDYIQQVTDWEIDRYMYHI